MFGDKLPEEPYSNRTEFGKKVYACWGGDRASFARAKLAYETYGAGLIEILLSSEKTEDYAQTQKNKTLHFLLLDVFDIKKEATFAQDMHNHFSSRFEAHDMINPLPFGKKFYSKSIKEMLN